MSASHNPGGPEEDFGIKFNYSGGEPAPEKITDKIFGETEKISTLHFGDIPDIDLAKVRPRAKASHHTALTLHSPASALHTLVLPCCPATSTGTAAQQQQHRCTAQHIARNCYHGARHYCWLTSCCTCPQVGTQKFGTFEVEVVDPVADYLDVLKSVFDFALLKSFISRPDFTMVFDSMHAVTGPYAQRILVQELGAPAASVKNGVPQPDFAGEAAALRCGRRC